MCLRVRRIEVRLALLEMFNLPSSVLRSYEAAMLASNLIAFGGCVRVLELDKRTANVRIRVSTHCGRRRGRSEPLLPLLSACWNVQVILSCHCGASEGVV